MGTGLQILPAILLMVAAVYAQKQLALYTTGGVKLMVARAILLLVGIGFGVINSMYIEGRLPQILAFLIGFGLVHMPAAVILFIKGKRGAGKS